MTICVENSKKTKKIKLKDGKLDIEALINFAKQDTVKLKTFYNQTKIKQKGKI